jgi:hypothetical protein
MTTPLLWYRSPVFFCQLRLLELPFRQGKIRFILFKFFFFLKKMHVWNCTTWNCVIRSVSLHAFWEEDEMCTKLRCFFKRSGVIISIFYTDFYQYLHTIDSFVFTCQRATITWILVLSCSLKIVLSTPDTVQAFDEISHKLSFRIHCVSSWFISNDVINIRISLETFHLP